MNTPKWYEEAKALHEQLIAWRRDLHRHPELGFQEHRTVGIVAEHLQHLGMEVQTGVAETGVIAILQGREDGPTIMLRFDMDALPIEEENDVPYRSEYPGVMHACGHDGHVAIGLGVATLLARHREALPGQVKFIFQPAEEGLGGARRMVAEGALEDPRPEMAFGLHLWNPLPVGQVVVQSGPFMAAAGRFEIEITGRGGHGAQPHLTVDATVVAAHVITALQTIVSRNVDPQHALVISVGELHAGSAFNVIPGQAILRGTLRAFDTGVMHTAQVRLRALAEGVAQAFGARADVLTETVAPPVVNDETATRIVREAACALLSEEQVVTIDPPMVSEDVSEFLSRVPGCFFFVGSRNEARGIVYGHHHPRFDIDEDALPIGVAILAEAAVRALTHLKRSRGAATPS